VNDLTKILIWVAIIGAIFALIWWKGGFKRISAYVGETREELKKCTWPTWDELKGHTVVVFVSILILGLFTSLIDRVMIELILRLT